MQAPSFYNKDSNISNNSNNQNIRTPGKTPIRQAKTGQTGHTYRVNKSGKLPNPNQLYEENKENLVPAGEVKHQISKKKFFERKFGDAVTNFENPNQKPPLQPRKVRTNTAVSPSRTLVPPSPPKPTTARSLPTPPQVSLPPNKAAVSVTRKPLPTPPSVAQPVTEVKPPRRPLPPTPGNIVSAIHTAAAPIFNSVPQTKPKPLPPIPQPVAVATTPVSTRPRKTTTAIFAPLPEKPLDKPYGPVPRSNNAQTSNILSTLTTQKKVSLTSQNKGPFITAKIPPRKIKDAIGAGLGKTIFPLQKSNDATEKLLKDIKLLDHMFPETKIKSLLPFVESILQICSPRNKAPLSRLMDGMKRYETLTLRQQVEISKELEKVLDDNTEFSGSDIATILSRHQNDFVKSLKHKLESPSRSRNEIGNLNKVLSLLNEGPDQIEQAYRKLNPRDRIVMSKFLSAYLKNKRCRAVFGQRNTSDSVENFEKEELAPIIELVPVIMSIDAEIAENKRTGNITKVKELLQLREGIGNIAVPKITNDHLGVVSKLFKFGDLKSLNPKDPDNTPKIRISSREMWEGMISVAQGLAALHALGFIHRDTAERNILVTDYVDFIPGPNGTCVKKYGLRFAIADLGRLRKLEDGTVPVEGERNPILWMAPEEFVEQKSSPKSDVYSLGMTLIESMIGLPAFRDHFSVKKTLDGLNQSDWSRFEVYCVLKKIRVDEGLKSVIKRCLEPNPKQRPSMKEVISLLQALDPDEAFLLKQASHQAN